MSGLGLRFVKSISRQPPTVAEVALTPKLSVERLDFKERFKLYFDQFS